MLSYVGSGRLTGIQPVTFHTKLWTLGGKRGCRCKEESML